MSFEPIPNEEFLVSAEAPSSTSETVSAAVVAEAQPQIEIEAQSPPEENNIVIQEDVVLGARIKVVGVGGGGCNAINAMVKAGLKGVEFITANTDRQALAKSLSNRKVQIGARLTKGLGAGANPNIGRESAEENVEEIRAALEGADMVFVTAGMGGGTGTGAAPVIARVARDCGALTVAVVTKPFQFEQMKRTRVAEQGLSILRDNVDTLIQIPNQKLLDICGKNTTARDAYLKADEVLLHAVQGISDLINNPGHINLDFADVRTVMTSRGLALMGTGVAQGENRAVAAAHMAISSPLLEDVSIRGATGIIINITGPEDLTLHEINEAVTLVTEEADREAEVIFGHVFDPENTDQVKVTVIATGFPVPGVQKQIHNYSVQPLGALHSHHPHHQSSHTHVAPQAPVAAPIVAPVQAAPVPTQMHVPAPVVAATPSHHMQAPMQTIPATAAPALGTQAQALHQKAQTAAMAHESEAAWANSQLDAVSQTVAPSPDLDAASETEEEIAAEPQLELGLSRNLIAAKKIARELGLRPGTPDDLEIPTFMRKGINESDPR